MYTGGAVLRKVTQDLLHVFEASVPFQAAERQPPRRQISKSDLDLPASPGWQGKAASAVIALAEVMFGASASWQGMQQQQQGKLSNCSQHSQVNSSFTATTATTSTITDGDPTTAQTSTDGKSLPRRPPGSDLADAAIHIDSSVLEPLVVQALDDFSNAGVWSLATHLDPDAAVSNSIPLTPQVHFHLTLYLFQYDVTCLKGNSVAPIHANTSILSLLLFWPSASHGLVICHRLWARTPS